MKTNLGPKSTVAMASFFFLFWFFAMPTSGYSQESIELPKGVQIEATGTGQTTGNIIRLTISNNSAETLWICLKKGNCESGSGTVLFTGLMFIPSSGKYQNYIVTGPDHIEVPPGSSGEYSLDGYCTDIHAPPVPTEVSAPDFDRWIFQGADTSDPETEPDFDVDFSGINLVERDPLQTVITNIPSDENLDSGQAIQVNLSENPSAGAPFIFDAFTRIEYTVDKLQENNLVTTAFHRDSLKERETLIQQTLWLYTSILTGDDYTKEDFRLVLTRQAEDEGLAIEQLPADQQEQFHEAVDNFWSSFTLVGVEAKVISANGLKEALRGEKEAAASGPISGAAAQGKGQAIKTPDKLGGEIGAAAGVGALAGDKKHKSAASGTAEGVRSAASEIADKAPSGENQPDDAEAEPPKEEKEEAESRCECGYISYFVNVKANDGKYDRNFEVIGDFANSNGNPQDEFEVKGLKVKPGDQIEITISDVEVECNCSNGGAGECEAYKPKKRYMDSERDTRSKPGTHKIFPGLGTSNIPVVKNNKDNSETTIEIPEKSDGDLVHIIGVSSVCAPDFCGEKSVNCVSYAVLSFDTSNE